MTKELKLKLVKELPELLDYLHNFKNKTTEFFWLNTFKEVTEREWGWIVSEVEKKLDVNKNVEEYKIALCQLCGLNEKNNIYENTDILTFASPEKRAEAYFQIKN